jgi:hypothetical protein
MNAIIQPALCGAFAFTGGAVVAMPATFAAAMYLGGGTSPLPVLSLYALSVGAGTLVGGKVGSKLGALIVKSPLPLNKYRAVVAGTFISMFVLAKVL